MRGGMDVCKESLQSRDLFGGVPAAQDYLESIQGIDPNDAVAITDMLEEMGPAVAEMDALAAREAYLYGYYKMPLKFQFVALAREHPKAPFLRAKSRRFALHSAR